jgi:hypothetical protein
MSQNKYEDMSPDALAIMKDVGNDLKKLKGELAHSDEGDETWKARLVKIAATIGDGVSPDNEPPTAEKKDKPTPSKPDEKDKEKEKMKESLNEDTKAFLKKYLKKFNKAFWWDGYSTPKDMQKRVRDMSDSNLISLAKDGYDNNQSKMDGTPRMFQIKAINRELKVRFGITPGNEIKTTNESFERGDSVFIKNAKDYDQYRSNVEQGTVVGMVGENVNVKLKLGSMTVSAADVFLENDLVEDSRSGFDKMSDSQFKNSERNSGLGGEKGRGDNARKTGKKPVYAPKNFVWGVFVDGKPFKMSGEQLTNRSKESLEKAITTLKGKSFNKDKDFGIKLVKESLEESTELSVGDSVMLNYKDSSSGKIKKIVGDKAEVLFAVSKSKQMIPLSKLTKLGSAAKKEDVEEACWKDYEMIGTKKKGGKEVPNCVKKEEVDEDELDEDEKMKGDDPCWKNYKMVGTKNKGGKEVPNCVKKESDISIFRNFIKESR